MKHVIIGNSAAGIGAAEGIRQINRRDEIAIITGEPHHTYSRPLISYLLHGKITEEKIKYRGDNFYKDNDCTLFYGTVTKICAETKRAILADGTRIPYDKLLVATGSSALVPPLAGLDTVKDKTSFISLDDARKLEKLLGPDKRVLIVGAGLIGLKCAEGVLGRVGRIMVLDLAPRILSSILDDDGAGMVQNHLEKNGVEFRLSSGIRSLKNNVAFLEGGETIDFDILVLAAGLSPNTSLLGGIAEIESGIVINEKSETTAPDIYAAGDCTQTFDVSSGRNKIMPLLPNAYMQGECAGINMAGGDARFDKAIPMNAVGFFGMHIITAGSYDGDVYAENMNGNYKRLFYGDNRLKGYILIGNVEKAGIYTNLIRERRPLDTIDFPLVCEKPGLMAFRQEERMMRLGGGV
ncbi:MAG: FAD-dependent oxidoreductase [Deltaproteobacteria bacterium]|nr:FAD-dependent oxidoreductase [Deltaproteobacteria bacterium]